MAPGQSSLSGHLPRTKEEFVANLAGRYSTLHDEQTITGMAPTRKFNSYIYSRRLLLRKTIEGDEEFHMIYCTHCTKGV